MKDPKAPSLCHRAVTSRGCEIQQRGNKQGWTPLDTHLRLDENDLEDFALCWPLRILVPQPGIDPVTPALGAQSLNHWTTGEVPLKIHLTRQLLFSYFREVFPSSASDTNMLRTLKSVKIPKERSICYSNIHYV